MMPLTLIGEGEEAMVRRVGGNTEVQHHLENLGFVPGSTVKVITMMGGNLIVQVKEARVAISSEMAQKIMVRSSGQEIKEEFLMKTLKSAKVGETVTVVKLHGEGAIKRRIMDMGITKGTQVYIRKVAPLGDPIEVTVRSYELSLRKADAEMVEVQ